MSAVEEGAKGPKWQTDLLAPADAKRPVSGNCSRHDTPALVFTASHGLGFPNGDPQQLGSRGRCSAATGRAARRRGPLSATVTRRRGRRGRRTRRGSWPSSLPATGPAPAVGRLREPVGQDRTPIAPRAFQSALPTRCSATRGRGAGGRRADRSGPGGVIEWAPGSSDRVVSGGAAGTEGRPAVGRLDRSTPLRRDLRRPDNMLGEPRGYKPVPPLELATGGSENNDARGYAVMGDPAVRLAVPGRRQAGADQARRRDPADRRRRAARVFVSPRRPKPRRGTEANQATAPRRRLPDAPERSRAGRGTLRRGRERRRVPVAAPWFARCSTRLGSARRDKHVGSARRRAADRDVELGPRPACRRRDASRTAGSPMTRTRGRRCSRSTGWPVRAGGPAVPGLPQHVLRRRRLGVNGVSDPGRTRAAGVSVPAAPPKRPGLIDPGGPLDRTPQAARRADDPSRPPRGCRQAGGRRRLERPRARSACGS